MQIISLTLPDALWRQLESEARLHRVTKSHLVRASLEKALGNGKEGARYHATIWRATWPAR